MLAPRPRRLVAAACAVASCAVLVHDCRATEEPAPATTGYAAIANRLQAHLGALWNEREQRYDSGPGAAVAEVNADLLLVHAIAAQRGLAGPPATRPPALYAYDPDTGRLAVTTPAYNTAIVAVNQRAFPYGGLDLARLFDGRQEVAGSIGGVAPAAFGLSVRDRAGRRLVSTQYGARAWRRGVAPLRLVKAACARCT
jgi:hypothetical protein